MTNHNPNSDQKCNPGQFYCPDPISLLDWINLNEVDLIENIQYHYKTVADVWKGIFLMSSPTFVYFFVFPFAYYYAPGVGLACLWASVVGDFISTVLKQYIKFIGQRPYWWVVISKHSNATLIQFDQTCQTTPGFPSNRLTIITACSLSFIWLMNNQQNKCERRGYLLIVGTLIILSSISQTFFATHFIYQMILSIFIGLLLAMNVGCTNIHNCPPIGYFRAGICILLIGEFNVNLLGYIGFSQNWAMKMASQACKSPDRLIHNARNPLVPYLRQVALLFGVGISLLVFSTVQACRIYVKTDVYRKVIAYSVVELVAYLVQCLLSHDTTEDPCYRATPNQVYMSTSLTHFILPILVILVAPRITYLYQTQTNIK